jgi:serine protease Do
MSPDRSPRQLRCLQFLLLWLPGLCGAVEPGASGLFETLRDRVFQVRVVDVASGDKTAIGSGFRVERAGLVATNFHVVSLLIHEPAKYRIELLGEDGLTRPATVLAIDVLHDLAILRDGQTDRPAFRLVTGTPGQGERIYSMGNPEDLGLTIIEGNYNGLIAASRFERLLFSGSLNPGMSGGPAFDRHGDVVGVNVAKGGEQLGFLVPAAHLKALLKRATAVVTPGDLKADIARALLEDSNAFYDQRLRETWASGPFGELTLPRNLSPSLKCWGQNTDKKDSDSSSFHQLCQSQEYLFLTEDFYTGDLSYSYEWMKAGRLNRFQFYNAVTHRYTHTSLENVDDEEHVTNFRCTTDFVRIDDTPWKASICLRRYLEYPALNDASLLLVSLHSNRGRGDHPHGCRRYSPRTRTRIVQQADAVD